MNWRWQVSSIFYRFSYIQLAHQLDEEMFAYLGSRVRDAVVADCGCGPGIVTEKFAYRGARCIFAVDTNEAMLQQMQHRLAAAGMLERVITVHQPFTPGLFAQLCPQIMNGNGFDIILFKRSLYLPTEQAVTVLKEAVASLHHQGVLVLIHGERSWQKYAFGPQGEFASYSLYHLFNRVVSLLGEKLGGGSYTLYTRQELGGLLKSTFPQNRVERIPSQQQAYNLFAIFKS